MCPILSILFQLAYKYNAFSKKFCYLLYRNNLIKEKTKTPMGKIMGEWMRQATIDQTSSQLISTQGNSQTHYHTNAN